MNLNYKHLSSGYIGKRIQFATLNSQFYGHFIPELTSSDSNLIGILAFPQRVPRSGFFEELISLENELFRVQFQQTLNLIIQKYNVSKTDLLDDICVDNARKFINYAKILMRYGQFDIVINCFPKKYSGPFELEIILILESCLIEREISQGIPININSLLTLTHRYINESLTTIQEKINLLSIIVVYFYRYQKSSTIKNDVINCAKSLIKLLEELEDDTFNNKLYSSISYRGLAMVSDFGMEYQKLILEKAEDIARKLKGTTEIEQIVASENLYTCLQTKSKWCQYNNDLFMAEHSLQEMIKVDPYDSTGYSELGLLQININKIEEAKYNFEMAAKLGPPGASMNLYYYAKCLEKTGQPEDAIQYLYHSAELDKQALSPWLDLLDHYSNCDTNSDQIKKIATHIYNTPILREQLEESEITYIQNIIN